MLTKEHMAMFVVKSVHIQINGQGYGSINCQQIEDIIIYVVVNLEHMCVQWTESQQSIMIIYNCIWSILIQ